MDHLPGFVLAGLALAGSPGPATLSLAATGAAYGARGGARYLTGIVLGMIAVMASAATGAAALVRSLPGAAPVVAVLMTAYFLYLAVRIATAPPLSPERDHRNRPSLAAGAVLSLTNPKGYAAMAALFSGFVLVEGKAAADLALKTGILFMIVVAVSLAWLSAGATLTKVFRNPRWNRIVNLVLAGLLVASLPFALVS